MGYVVQETDISQSITLIKYIVLLSPLEMDQPSISVSEEVPLTPVDSYQQEVNSLNQEDQQAMLLLKVKEEQDQGMQRQGPVKKHCVV